MNNPVQLVHCSYHKCLTVYYQRVLRTLLNRALPWSRGYRHFNSDVQAFYQECAFLHLASVNNRCIDLTRFERLRLSRFIRDPRDLVVSGYFYHLSGKEAWTAIVQPSESDWYFANGVIPGGMRNQPVTFSEYLRSLPIEEGLLAELEFRRNHFQSMLEWPERHPDIVTFRYEDVVRDEPGAMEQLFKFYGFNGVEKVIGNWLAKRHAVDRVGVDAHVRNPASGQWREHFTPRVRRIFDRRYAGLIRKLGYPSD